MIIDYWTHNNCKVTYSNGADCYLDASTLNYVSKIYCELTNEIPDKLFIGLQAHEFLINSFFNISSNNSPTPLNNEKLYAHITLPYVGVLQIVPVVKPNLDFLMIGQNKDYNRYIVGEVFEKEVLG